MQHTFFALFDSPENAAAAVADLERGGALREEFGIVVHKDRLAAGELHLGETAARRGLAGGAVAGGVIGALFGGLILGPLGLVGAGAAATALFGGVVGTAYGGAMGGLAAASGPDPTLEALAAQLAAGKVLLTVEAGGLTSEEHAEDIVARHGGQVYHRTAI